MNDTLLNVAYRMQQAGNPSEAARIYGEILMTNPRHFQALYMLAYVHFGNASYETAERLFEMASNVDPKFVDAYFARGCALLNLGRYDGAMRSFDKAVALKRDHADALVNRGVCLLELRRHEDAFRDFANALAIDPRHVEALVNRGAGLLELKRFREALPSLEQALMLAPNHAKGMINRANALRGLERHDEALSGYDAVLAADAANVGALINRGVLLAELQRQEDALVSFDRAMALAPGRVEAWFARANALAALERLSEAIASYDHALTLDPNHVLAWNNRGAALYALKRYDEAVASYDKALALQPEDTIALINRGIALTGLRRHENALSNFDTVLRIDPHHAAALFHRGNTLLGLRRFAEAFFVIDRSLSIAPDNPDALVARGIALKEQGKFEAAIADYDAALALKPNSIEALFNREVTLFEMKRYEEAAATCERALALDPEIRYVRGDRVFYRLQCCAWDGLAADETDIAARLAQGQRVIQPFMNIALGGSAEAQMRCAHIWMTNECPPRPEPLWRGEHYRHGRIRLAYVSGDFRNHPVTQLMAGVFEHHDRTRFETIAISLDADDNSSLRRRAAAAFAHFIDARGKDDAEIAHLLKKMEVDIAVDLMGFTGKSHPDILAHRAAPVQAQYLGFPGTMAANYIDYIVADETVIPEEQRTHYREKVVYLPDSYIPSDSKRAVARRAISRKEVGLPDEGFIFCSFNNSYKFSPVMFDVWMRLLRQVPRSVLWLSQNNPAAVRNLKREAEVRGIAPDRLRFAAFLPAAEEHMARLQLADLFLDTLPFNAHTTASDALWAGVPVLTCLGSAFAGRVAASLNRAAGLLELVTQSLAEYEALALRLARDPAALSVIKAKLANNRATHPLFDTARFTKHLEAAFTSMWERANRGERLSSFAVERIP